MQIARWFHMESIHILFEVVFIQAPENQCQRYYFGQSQQTKYNGMNQSELVCGFDQFLLAEKAARILLTNHVSEKAKPKRTLK